MRAFLDTNVLAYRLDPDEPDKQERVVQWLERDVEFMISTQVLIELHAVLTSRFRIDRGLAREVVESLDYETIPTDRALILRATETAEDHELSIFDALIVEAAARAHCDELWTEDLTDGQVIRGLTIVNPFSDAG